MYSDLLRKHVKLCTFDEIQASIAAVVPERFSMEQKSALASSVWILYAVLVPLTTFADLLEPCRAILTHSQVAN